VGQSGLLLSLLKRVGRKTDGRFSEARGVGADREHLFFTLDCSNGGFQVGAGVGTGGVDHFRPLPTAKNCFGSRSRLSSFVDLP